LRTVNLFAYTVARPYNIPKSFSQDVRVFLKAVRVAAMMRRMEVTHLHAPWGDTNAFIGMVAAHLAGADFSLQFRAQDLHRRTLAFMIGEKVRNARFVVTNTRYNLEHLRALAPPRDHAKIHQIYNGLDLERMNRLASSPERGGSDEAGDGREPAAPGRGPLRIFSVARLIEPKGLPYLFEACRMLLDRGRELRCRVVGGPELPLYVNDLVEIRRARRLLGLEDVVELVGAQPFARVIEGYRQADVFALPCVVGADASNDIIPNVILEAMAMGVPVVATSITAIPELIEDGETGLLVPPNDAAALAEALDRLIADPELRRRLAANARARVAERFDVSKNVRAYVELFRSS
jgi:glycosyltransferase involved in cell wall biosynthesis